MLKVTTALLVALILPSVHATSLPTPVTLIDWRDLISVLLIFGPGLVANFIYPAAMRRTYLELRAPRRKHPSPEGTPGIESNGQAPRENSSLDKVQKTHVPGLSIDAATLPGLTLGVAFSVGGIVLTEWYVNLIGLSNVITYLNDPVQLNPDLLLRLTIHTLVTMYISAVFGTIHALLDKWFPKSNFIPKFDDPIWFKFWKNAQETAAESRVTLSVTTKDGTVYFGQILDAEPTDSTQGLILGEATTAQDLLDGLPATPQLFIESSDIRALGMIKEDPPLNSPVDAPHNSDGLPMYTSPEGGDDEEA